jgi:twitching motility protein PilI
MQKKEALSQFQTRLADRLASTGIEREQSSANWLAVEIANEGFVLPLGQSGEIFPWCEPQPIPYTKEWFLGVANLRGALCGVVSLTKYLELESQAEDSKTALQDRRLVGFHPSFELNTVFIVDKLVGLKNQGQMEATGQENLYRDSLGKTWRELDLGKLSKTATFTNVAQN